MSNFADLANFSGWGLCDSRVTSVASEGCASRGTVSTGSSRATDSTDMNVKPSQFDTLSALVDATALRHRVLAQNVANVNTPGYRRMDVSFEDVLAKRIRRTGNSDLRARDLRNHQAEIVLDDSAPMRRDGSNVDIDTEMGTLAKNKLLHNTWLQIIASKNATMRRAIGGSGS